jgi:AcrR family transcriptional regulator
VSSAKPVPTAARGAARRITDDDIVSAAVQLTRDNGLSQLTLRSVALALGMQSPSLYHHIPGGLEDLQARVVDRVVAEFEHEVQSRAVPEESGWPRLERSLRAVGRLSREYPGVLQYVMSTGRHRAPALASAEQTVLQLLRSDLGPMTPAAWLLVHTYVTGWVFAQRPSSAAANAEGFHELGAVLTQAEDLDQEKVLFEGLRALLAGLLVSAPEHEEPVPGAVNRALRKFLR